MEKVLDSAAASGDQRSARGVQLLDDHDGCCDEKPGEKLNYEFRDETACFDHFVWLSLRLRGEGRGGRPCRWLDLAHNSEARVGVEEVAHGWKLDGGGLARRPW